MKAMNIKESYEWLRRNTCLMQDTTMLDFECLAFAVKKGILFEVDKEHFIPRYLVAFESRYIVDEVYKVPDEIVKSEMLQYPNRLKAHLVKACRCGTQAGRRTNAPNRQSNKRTQYNI